MSGNKEERRRKEGGESQVVEEERNEWSDCEAVIPLPFSLAAAWMIQREKNRIRTLAKRMHVPSLNLIFLFRLSFLPYFQEPSHSFQEREAK